MPFLDRFKLSVLKPATPIAITIGNVSYNTSVEGSINGTGRTIEDPYEEPIFFIHMILPPTIIVVGIFGNILSYLILRQPKYADQSTCFYMRILAISDTTELLFLNLQRYMWWLFPQFFRENGHWFCREYMYCFHLTMTNSHWILVFMTVDRFIAVLFPLKSRTLCTTSRARKALIGLISISLIVNCQWFMSVFSPESLVLKEKCALPDPRHEQISQTVVLSLVFFVPLLIVTCSNISIVATVIMRHRKKKNLGLGYSTSDAGSDVSLHSAGMRLAKERQITAMLLLVSGMFILALAPYSFDYFIWNYDDNLEHIVQTDYNISKLRNFLYEISATLMTLNPGINFYMYMLSCHKFREDLKFLFMGCCGRTPRQSPIHDQNGINSPPMRSKVNGGQSNPRNMEAGQEANVQEDSHGLSIYTVGCG